MHCIERYRNCRTAKAVGNNIGNKQLASRNAGYYTRRAIYCSNRGIAARPVTARNGIGKRCDSAYALMRYAAYSAHYRQLIYCVGLRYNSIATKCAGNRISYCSGTRSNAGEQTGRCAHSGNSCIAATPYAAGSSVAQHSAGTRAHMACAAYSSHSRQRTNRKRMSCEVRTTRIRNCVPDNNRTCCYARYATRNRVYCRYGRVAAAPYAACKCIGKGCSCALAHCCATCNSGHNRHRQYGVGNRHACRTAKAVGNGVGNGCSARTQAGNYTRRKVYCSHSRIAGGPYAARYCVGKRMRCTYAMAGNTNDRRSNRQWIDRDNFVGYRSSATIGYCIENRIDTYCYAMDDTRAYYDSVTIAGQPATAGSSVDQGNTRTYANIGTTCDNACIGQ